MPGRCTYISATGHVDLVYWSFKMSFTVQKSHRIVSMLVAIVVTIGLQGTLLAGFNHLADQGQSAELANCNAASLPVANVTPGRS
jgi:hypothetical protein